MKNNLKNNILEKNLGNPFSFFPNKFISFKSYFMKNKLLKNNNSVDNSSQTTIYNTKIPNEEIKLSEVSKLNISFEEKKKFISLSPRIKKKFKLNISNLRKEKKKKQNFLPNIIDKKIIQNKITNFENIKKKKINLKKQFIIINKRIPKIKVSNNNNIVNNFINLRRFDCISPIKFKKNYNNDINSYINFYEISPEKKCLSIRLTNKIIGDIYI